MTSTVKAMEQEPNESLVDELVDKLLDREFASAQSLRPAQDALDGATVAKQSTLDLPIYRRSIVWPRLHSTLLQEEEGRVRPPADPDTEPESKRSKTQADADVGDSAPASTTAPLFGMYGSQLNSSGKPKLLSGLFGMGSPSFSGSNQSSGRYGSASAGGSLFGSSNQSSGSMWGSSFTSGSSSSSRDQSSGSMWGSSLAGGLLWGNSSSGSVFGTTRPPDGGEVFNASKSQWPGWGFGQPSNVGGGDEEGDDDPEREVKGGNYKIVSLEELNGTTGEENEDVIFSARSKLFRFRDNDWRERGIGEAKLLKNMETGKARLLFRHGSTKKVLANHLIPPYCDLKQKEALIWLWTAQDYSDEAGPVTEQFALRFGTADTTNKFKRYWDDAKATKASASDEKDGSG